MNEKIDKMLDEMDADIKKMDDTINEIDKSVNAIVEVDDYTTTYDAEVRDELSADDVKKVLKYVARNKDSIMMLLEGLDEKNIEKGSFALSDKFIKTAIEEFADKLEEKSQGMLKALDLSFDAGAVRLFVKVKKFVALKVSYDIKVEEFAFDSTQKRIRFSYNKKGFSFGNTLIGLALFIAKIVLKKDKLPEGISWNGKQIEILPELMTPDAKIPSWLKLTYEGSEGGLFKIGYEIN